MITKRDYKNMIVSHPANTISKFKLSKMKREELANYWEKITKDNRFTDKKSLLYSDHETDNETVHETNHETVHETVHETIHEKKIKEPIDEPIDEPILTLDDMHKKIQYKKSQSPKLDVVDEGDEESITPSKLKKIIEVAKMYFIDNMDSNNLEELVNEVNDIVNDSLDECIGLSKRGEIKIIDDFNQFIKKYIS